MAVGGTVRGGPPVTGRWTGSAASWKAAALAGWMAVTGIAAASSSLRFDSMPPTMVILLVAMFIASFGIGFSRTGERLALGLPLALLVGFQAFRLPLEVFMHRAYEEGVMPVQMRRLPLWVVRAWNVMGALLLVNVLAIAMMSTRRRCACSGTSR